MKRVLIIVIPILILTSCKKDFRDEFIGTHNVKFIKYEDSYPPTISYRDTFYGSVEIFINETDRDKIDILFSSGFDLTPQISYPTEESFVLTDIQDFVASPYINSNGELNYGNNVDNLHEIFNGVLTTDSFYFEINYAKQNLSKVYKFKSL